MLGKSTSGFKNGVIPTQELWQGIHFTKDVAEAPEDLQSHLIRVYNKENSASAFNANKLAPTFGPVRDKFVEKYEPLLKQTERKGKLEMLARRSREFLIQKREKELKKRIADDPPQYIKGV